MAGGESRASRDPSFNFLPNLAGGWVEESHDRHHHASAEKEGGVENVTSHFSKRCEADIYLQPNFLGFRVLFLGRSKMHL